MDASIRVRFAGRAYDGVFARDIVRLQSTGRFTTMPSPNTDQIDLRSDTVTQPSDAMRAAIAKAEVGDDVYTEDPTVRRLEQSLAERTGHDAGMFCPSGTQSNLLGLLAHCERGDEYIVGQTGHTYKYEGGGAAVLGSIQPQPLDFQPDGTLCLDAVETAVKPLDAHFARTRLLCLENTVAGQALPLEYLPKADATARRLGLAQHLDGARIFNAAIYHGVPLDTLTRQFDSVSICLSKGLGAPVGSVLVGSNDLIEKARRWRKVTGGGMRQAGFLAAAGLYAIEHNVERLAEDHANAERLAKGLNNIEGIDAKWSGTNMVLVSDTYRRDIELKERLERDNIIVSLGKAGRPMRLVTHLDVSRSDIDRVVAAFNSNASIIAVEAVG